MLKQLIIIPLILISVVASGQPLGKNGNGNGNGNNGNGGNGHHYGWDKPHHAPIDGTIPLAILGLAGAVIAYKFYNRTK